MSDRSGLLRAVLESPHDDAPRLIYADALEESGPSPLARLIRWSCHPSRRHELTTLHGEEFCQLFLKDPFCFVQFAGLPGCVTTGYRRGMVEAVTVPTAREFLGRAADLFRSHPVTAVALADPRPVQDGPHWCWLRADRHVRAHADLPRDLFDRLPGSSGRFLAVFETQADATAALSAACVACGRDACGLPPLGPPAATPG